MPKAHTFRKIVHMAPTKEAVSLLDIWPGDHVMTPQDSGVMLGTGEIAWESETSGQPKAGECQES